MVCVNCAFVIHSTGDGFHALAIVIVWHLQIVHSYLHIYYLGSADMNELCFLTL